MAAVTAPASSSGTTAPTSSNAHYNSNSALLITESQQRIDTLSSSLLQRRLRIGFPRAARLMEHLYEMGLVEDPKEGGKTRRTFVDDENDPFSDLP